MMLAMQGHTGRSGGAAGADTAFERGMRVIDPQSIHVFPGHLGHYLAWQHHAAQYHPAWDRCDVVARKLHARNSAIMLGPLLTQPVDAVLCWTEGGAVKGGTGQGLRIAAAYRIPVFNLATVPIDAMWEWMLS